MKVSDFFDKRMLEKYNTTGPRYTSYPTAVAFHDLFGEAQFSQSVNNIVETKPEPSLSLYVHIPFCHSLCYYCGCNKIVTRNQDKVEQYLAYLKQEIKMRATQFTGFSVNNLHFGGGTPSFLTVPQFSDLLAVIYDSFSFSSKLEQSIEIDPRRIELDYIDELRTLGFTRLSIGVQDVNKDVQEKINRVQSTDFIKDIIKRAKLLAFDSVSIDLIYGLPAQTAGTLAQTFAEVELMNPDRISLFSYAHMPSLFPSQRKIKEEWMPSNDTKFALFRQSIQTLTTQGYEFIGMDHFAKQTDELSQAAKENRLMRNFQGYTTDQADCLLGLGVSSISNLGTAYSQNVKSLKHYYEALDGNKLLIEKGVSLTRDDVIHRAIINQLMCNFHVDKARFEKDFDIDFDVYFAQHIKQLDAFIKDDLVSNTQNAITIHSKGRLLVRNICMNFDQYLKMPSHQLRYSRVI